MKIKALTLVALSLAGLTQSAGADGLDGMDWSLGTGAVAGTVTATRDDRSERTFRIGGIPLAAMLNHDLQEKWTANFQFQALLDMINQQMVRQGVAGSLCYHLLGGARRLFTPGDIASTVSTSVYNLSLMSRVGVFNFAATEPKNPSQTLSGGVWEFAIGMEFRRSFTDASSAGVSALRTLLTLPASVDRLASRTTELQIFWRFYL